MNKILVYLIVIELSLKWMFRVTLGDKVYYKGKKYLVSNGVRENCWRLNNLYNGDNGWVRRNQCKKVWSLKGMISSFWRGYCFYMGYWYDIWVGNGIEEWMKQCRIW